MNQKIIKNGKTKKASWKEKRIVKVSTRGVVSGKSNGQVKKVKTWLTRKTTKESMR